MELFTFQFYDQLSDLTLYLSIIILYLHLIFNKRGRIVDFTLALMTAIASSYTIKYLTGVSRPEGILIFNDSSFPSMHTTLAFTVFFFFLNVCHKLTTEKGFRFTEFRQGRNLALAIILGLLSTATGLLRFISTAHHLTDVFAGIILGLIISLFFAYYDFSMRRVK